MQERNKRSEPLFSVRELLARSINFSATAPISLTTELLSTMQMISLFNKIIILGVHL